MLGGQPYWNLSVRLIVAIVVFMLWTGFNLSQAQSPPEQPSPGQPANLPLPSSMPLVDYERVLYDWLMRHHYKTLNWAVDKGVRDTGPYIQGQYYGTHPAVRVYYSPEIVAWLQQGRQGTIPDGAMIIKEMFKPPAALYQELKNDPKYQNDPSAYEAMLNRLIADWTVMVRDSNGSKDGWFWAGPGAPKAGQSIEATIASQLDNYSHILYSSFGAPCLRCHGSAENELTFSSLGNIQGFLPDEAPLRFRVDESWRSQKHLDQYPLSLLADDPYAKSLFVLPTPQQPWSGTNGAAPATATPNAQPLNEPNSAFTAMFGSIAPAAGTEVKAFPKQWADHVVAGPNDPQLYLTSDNCLGCHGGLGGTPSGVTMFIPTGPGYGNGFNLSEYGEWRWSPMGLAGRDPIFHAQLESEMALLEQDAKVPGLLKGSLADNQQAVTNTCLSCHGAMGQRQLQLDAEKDQSLDPNFKPDYFYLTEALSASDPQPPDYAYHKYGALAREGISCMTCHHIAPPNPQAVQNWQPPEPAWLTDKTDKTLAYLLFHNNTGRYEAGPANELFGPFEQVAEMPMHHTLGITPTHNAFTADSQMCGTCHTINLPNIGMTEDKFPVLTAAEQNPALKPYPHTIEQATFLEWQNSAFAAAGPQFQSCQDCHMPGGFKTLDGKGDVPQLVTQIATIQDTTYPQAEHELPAKELDIPLRSDYKRHEHVGLNTFLLEMFNQYDSVLGVDKSDYMTGATNGNALAQQNMVRQAQNDTVDLAVQVDAFQNNVLTASITVTNKTGHRFPSGVTFRRAFLEFLVLNGNEIIWSSGRTNSLGVIVDGAGWPLKTEFLPNSNTYQRHYQTITNQAQVQIYEELTQNAAGEFTTSFVHRVHSIKDNRLLPKGWRAAEFFKDQGEVMFEFMESTDPEGEDVFGDAAKNLPSDPDYADQGPGFPGQDHLRYVVTLPPGLDPANLTVKVTMNYQAIPPYFLQERFTLAPHGEATQRLYYLTSHLDLKGTAMEDWKLPLVSAVAQVK